MRLSPDLDRVLALFEYRAPVDQWVRGLKFHGDLTLAKLLGQLLAEHAPERQNVLLVPVPLHRHRLRQRGFNQALEIARPLRRRGYRIDAHCCSRKRHTPPQSELPAKARLHNLHDAFEVRHSVKGNNIVLIDDVFTTGSTLNSLAASLKEAGAVKVEAWVIARTAGPGTR
ncbi:ComF family protein [Thiogranum longum]|uniref:ComF family protein n=1 Tax=Thiogranum longum TaxID=1537524 RepID=UPI001403E5B7|nr:ComF family protein [Thiogranum longum]